MILTSLVVLVLTSPTANLGLRDLSVLQISRVETSDRKARENRLTTIFRNFRLRVTIQRFRSVHLAVGLCVCVCGWVAMRVKNPIRHRERERLRDELFDVEFPTSEPFFPSVNFLHRNAKEQSTNSRDRGNKYDRFISFVREANQAGYCRE